MVGKKRILVLDNQIVVPPESGGPLRIYNLFSNLPDYEVTYLGVTGWQYLPREKKHVKGSFYEQIIPLSKPFIILNNFFHNVLKSIPTFDISCAFFMSMTPEFMRVFAREAKRADIIITSHPWFAIYILKYGDKVRIYDSHNCEYLLYKAFFRKNLLNSIFLRLIHHIERNACNRTDIVLSCSEEDRENYARIYKTPLSKVAVLPNPVDVGSIPLLPPERRLELREKYKVSGKTVLFVGTYFLPNIQAFHFILKRLAPAMPDHTFLVVGTVCRAYAERLAPGRRLPDRQDILGLGWFDSEKWGSEGFDVRWTKKEFSFLINREGVTRIVLNVRSLKKISGSMYIDGRLSRRVTFKTGIEFKEMEVPIRARRVGQVKIVLDRLSKSLFFDTRDVGIAVRALSYTSEGIEYRINMEETIIPYTLPDNVRLLGRISNESLREILNISDVAINPVVHGSGLNIKMLDYLAANIPTITTKVGARGLGIEDSRDIRIVDLAEFASCIRNASSAKTDLRELVRQRFDIEIVTRGFSSILGSYQKNRH